MEHAARERGGDLAERPASGSADEAAAPVEAEGARARLLAAAGPVFARRGFDRATVREICREANVNVAAVAYYFGDKMGLYRQVIREIHARKEQRYPAPVDGERDPVELLHLLIRTMLSRMLACDSSGWESQLMMREMQQPTAVFGVLVEESFRPVFDRLVEIFRQVVAVEVPVQGLQQLAFSAVGQCLYYRFAAGVLAALVPEEERRKHYDIETLSRHIAAVMLAAAESGRAWQYQQTRLGDAAPIALESEPSESHE